MRCSVYQQGMHHWYLWRAQGVGLQVFCRFLFLKPVCWEAYNKMNTPDFCGFCSRAEIPRAAVCLGERKQNKNKAPLNYLDYSQHFLEIWLQNAILELIPKCLGVWGCSSSRWGFFQFCYELLLKWQGNFLSVWLFLTKDWLKVGVETQDWNCGQ